MLSSDQLAAKALAYLEFIGFARDPRPEAKPTKADLPLDRGLITLGTAVVLRRGADAVCYGKTPGFNRLFFLKRGDSPWRRVPGAAIDIKANLERAVA